jgi:hypothetical protein
LIDAAMASSSPDFVQPNKRPPSWRGNRWLWLAAFALTISLFLQIALADRAQLAADPVWRPRIIALCDLLRCKVPTWHEPGALHIISREIRRHPSAPGVLLVTATFRNDAAFAQAWPQLQLSLTNLDGDSFGLRRFSPREYLGNDPATPLIGVGQSATITLEVIDPGQRAVAFGFDFR